jgi:hypothetical protein
VSSIAAELFTYHVGERAALCSRKSICCHVHRDVSLLNATHGELSQTIMSFSTDICCVFWDSEPRATALMLCIGFIKQSDELVY